MQPPRPEAVRERAREEREREREKRERSGMERKRQKEVIKDERSKIRVWRNMFCCLPHCTGFI